MEKKEKMRKILSITFAFLLSLSLVGSLAIGVLKTTLLDKNFFLDKLEESGYTRSLHDKIIEELSTEGYVSGFDEAFFSQIIDVELLKVPVLASVERIYGTGEYQAISVDEMSAKFFKEFVSSLESRGAVVDDEQKVQIENFAKESAQYLSGNARLPFLSIGEGMMKNAKPLTTYGLIFLVAFSIFCIYFIITTNPKSKESLRYLSYSLTATALMMFIPVVLMSATGILQKVSITDKAFYDLVQIIGNDILFAVGTVAVVTGIVSSLLTVLYFKPQKPKEN